MGADLGEGDLEHLVVPTQAEGPKPPVLKVYIQEALRICRAWGRAENQEGAARELGAPKHSITSTFYQSEDG